MPFLLLPTLGLAAGDGELLVTLTAGLGVSLLSIGSAAAQLAFLSSLHTVAEK